jgi:hypothetical protein
LHKHKTWRNTTVRLFTIAQTEDNTIQMKKVVVLSVGGANTVVIVIIPIGLGTLPLSPAHPGHCHGDRDARFGH